MWPGHDLHSTIDLCQVAVWNVLRWLEADTDLEASWAPVDELDGTLRLQSRNSRMYVLRDNVSTVQKTSSHVFAISRITFDHLVVRLEARH